MTILTEMLTIAKQARAKAYAPYSQFKVGACIRSHTDKLYSGCNHENASYGLSYCAEVTAIGNMVVNGEQAIKEILIIGPNSTAVTPCGRCRQNIFEFGGDNIIVHLCDGTGVVKTLPLIELLPYSFSQDILDKS
jgi:cytidine deaminase